MPTDEHTYTTDLDWVRRIIDGDDEAWNAFVDRFTDRVWRRSWQLCDEACPFNRATVFCVFHALAKDHVQPGSDDRPGCDEGLEIYAFIFDYFHNKRKGTGKLKHYDGRSKIDTFVAAVLHGHLRTDWIRHKRKLRVDQITRPTEIQRLSKPDGRVFEQMVMQRSIETISSRLGMPYEEVAAAQERVTHALMTNGNLHLILRSPESPVDEFDPSSRTSSLQVIPLTRSVDAIWDAVCELIGTLPENEKILLSMMFDKELDAKVILERCTTLDIELPVRPRTGNVTIHSIYQSIDAILKNLGEMLQSEHAKLLREAHDWLDDDSVSTSVSVKGLKALLKHMGIAEQNATNGRALGKGSTG